MIDINLIKKDKELIKKNIVERGLSADVDNVISSHEDLKKTRILLESLQSKSNNIAKNIPNATAKEKETLIKNGGELKSKVAEMKNIEKIQYTKYRDLMLTIPNFMAEDTPTGLDDAANKPINHFGTPTKFNFPCKDHLEIGTTLDLLDFEGGAKVAGNKFYFLKNEAVYLDMALQQFAMQTAVKHGFMPLVTPDLARNEILEGVGFAPRGEESNTYALEGQELSLIATAEIAVGGLYSKQIIPTEELPILCAAYSHCFRREAGSGGQSSKGLYRVHQFGKVELFAITTVEDSEKMLEKILAVEEEIFQELKIPYRVVRICAGDLGAPAFKKYDIEAWMPGKGEGGEYGEVTSASNCTDYQSRRLNIRYKDSHTNKNLFAHTLNGTAIAISRALVAILENYQTSEGKVLVPDALKPYMHGMNVIGTMKLQKAQLKKSASKKMTRAR